MFTRKIALQGDTHNLTEGLGARVVGAAAMCFCRICVNVNTNIDGHG